MSFTPRSEKRSGDSAPSYQERVRSPAKSGRAGLWRRNPCLRSRHAFRQAHAQEPGSPVARPRASRRARGHSQITPAHLLRALLAQPEGSTVPILQKIGVPLDAPAGRRSSSVLGACRRCAAARSRSSRARPRRVLDAAFKEAEQLKDEYVSTEHLLLALAQRQERRRRRAAARRRRHARRDPQGARRGARQRARHRPGPRGQVPGAREVRPRPHRARAHGQARPGDRPRRGDPPRDPGALAAHQEQPGADRRARRRQDRDRRGPRPAHRRRRRARERSRTSA